MSNGFKIGENIEIYDISLKIKDHIVISDLHLGYEYALNRGGFMIPKFQFKKITDRLIEIMEQTKAKKIVINGDLKHDFGRINRQESKEVKELIEFLDAYLNDIIVIKGNHDNFTEYILNDYGIDLLDSYSLDDNLILHGHKLIKDFENIEEDNIIIGHEHPCIGIRNGERTEKIKCFLKGNLNTGNFKKNIEGENKNLIVLPSFNFISEGSDILQEKQLSSYLKKSNINEFEIFAVEDFEVFTFGTYKDLIEINKDFI